MWETKTVLVSLSIILLVAANFCIYEVHTEKKVGHHSKIKSQSPCKNKDKKYCLNSGECYYLVDEDIVGCNCTWLMKEHVAKITCSGVKLEFQIRSIEKKFYPNLSGLKTFSTKSKTLWKENFKI